MGKARILVVDDDPVIRQLIAATLESGNLEAVACGRPEEAVELARAQGVDAVVLDLMMPGMSGFEVLGQFRNDPFLGHTPILILSAKTAGEDRAEGLRAGADDYMAKPFDPAELLIRVERLATGRGGKPDVILAGELGGLAAGDILQQVLASGMNGVLHIGGRPPGWVAVHEGAIRAAACGSLEGEPALLVLLDRREGRFRFLKSDEAGAAGGDGVTLGLQGALMQLAWLEDELERHRAFLPGPDVPLVREMDGPALESECERLEDVLSWFEERSGATLRQLEEAGVMAPQQARLAVAMAVSEGLLTVGNTEAGRTGMGTEGEVAGPSEAIDGLCTLLESRSVVGGRAPGVVHVLVAVAPTRWEPFVDEFIGGFPDDLLGRSVDQVLAELRTSGSASLRVRCSGQTLLLHVHRLGGLSALRARAFLTLAAFIVLAPSVTPSQGEEEFLGALDQVAGRGDTEIIVVPSTDGLPEDVQLPEGSRIASRIPESLEALLETLLG